MKWVVAVMMLMSAASAADTCPVHIDRAFGGFESTSVTFHNTSDKKIVGVEFLYFTLNPVGERYTRAVVTGKTDAKPGDKKTVRSYHQTDSTAYDKAGQGAELRAVKFDDGSTWTVKDSPTAKCEWQK